MNVMKAIAHFFLALKTAFGLFFAFIILAVAGSFILTGNLAFFSGIDEAPLFRWLAQNRDIGLTWWIYLMIVMLTGLAVSTLFCTAESLMKGMWRQNPVLRLSPQVMHAGVLFIMLGHLLTASFGFKMDLQLKKGETLAVAEGKSLLLEDCSVQTDKNGYPADWLVRLRWIEDGKQSPEYILKPVHPLYLGQFGLYLQAANAEDSSTLIRVSKDPGALWALFGGILLCLGGAGFVFSRFKVDRKQTEGTDTAVIQGK